MPYDIDADIAAFAEYRKIHSAEAEAQQAEDEVDAINLVNMYHKLALSEVTEEDPFADILCDGAQLPDWDERHVYTCPVDRVGMGAACPTRDDLEEMDVKDYNRKVLKHINVHAAGTRFVPPPYFYDKDGKRVSR